MPAEAMRSQVQQWLQQGFVNEHQVVVEFIEKFSPATRSVQVNTALDDLKRMALPEKRMFIGNAGKRQAMLTMIHHLLS